MIRRIGYIEEIKKRIIPKITEENIDILDFLEEGFFLLKDFSIGHIFEVVVSDQIFMDNTDLSSFLNDIKKSVSNSFRDFFLEKDGCDFVIQFFYQQRPYFERNQNDEGHLNKEISEIFLKEKEYVLENFCLFDRRLFACFRIIPKVKEENRFIKGLKNFIKTKEIEKDSKITEFMGGFFRSFRESISLFESSCPRYISLRKLQEDELTDFINEKIQDEKRIKIKDVDLKDSFVFSDLREFRDCTLAGEKKIFSFYIDQIPKGGESSLPFGSMCFLQNQEQFKSFDFVWTFSSGECQFKENMIIKKAWFERRPLSKELEEIESFQEKIGFQNPFGKLTLRIFFYNIERSDIPFLKSFFIENLNSRLVLEKQIPFHMFITGLPLNCRPEDNDLLGGRTKTIDLQNALFFAPIFPAQEKKIGHFLLPSILGAPSSFDLFAGDSNRMTMVLAQSGGGKSVFASYALLDFLGRFPESPVRIIDIKTSYRKTASLFGGVVINFDRDSIRQSNFNPFFLEEPSESDLEDLFLLLQTVIYLKSPEFSFSPIHTEILRKSLFIAFETFRESFKSFDDIYFPNWQDVKASMAIACNELFSDSGIKDIEKFKNELVQASICLDQNGEYGDIFSSSISVKTKFSNKNDNFIIFDLDGISDPVLKKIACLVAFNRINKDFSSFSKKTKKLIVLEELGVLLSGNDSGQEVIESFISKTIKTCRKVNAQIIGITNDVADYSKTKAGKSLWANSTQKIFLPLGPMSSLLIEDFKNFFTEAEEQVLSILKKNIEKKYSMAYIRSENESCQYKMVVKIPLSPWLDALTTTSPNQLSIYEELLEKVPALEAIKAMAEHFPYGQKND